MAQEKKPSELRLALAGCRRQFAAVALFSLAINLLYLASPIYLLQIYDRVIPSGSEVTLVMLSVALLVSVGALATLDIIRSKILQRASLRLDRFLADRVLSASVAAHAPGSIRSQALRDLDAIRQYLAGGSVQAAFDLPWVPLYLTIIFLLHPVLGGFALSCAGLLIMLALANEWVTRRSQREANDATNRGYGFAEASLRNAEVITALGMSEALTARWRRERDRSLTAQQVASGRSTTIAGITKFSRMSMQSLILGLGAYLAIERMATVGAIFAASVILGRALQPVEIIVGAWRNTLSAGASYARVNQLLREAPILDDTLELPRPSGALSAEGLYCQSPGQSRWLLNNVTFRIEAGEVLGIVGASGAGKSTLARHIVGVLKPRSGVVRLDGAEVATWPHESLGRYVGYLPQDIELFADTVAFNISRFQAGQDAEIIRAAQLARAHDTILRLPNGYRTTVGEGGSQLSGGARQRIALARAVFGQPSLLVLDEPSSNLDLEGETALNECIADLKATGTTVVIISHRPTTLALADKILVLREGAVEAFGERTEVLSRYARVTGAPDRPVSVARTAAAG